MKNPIHVDYCYTDGALWFRIFGKGFCIVDRKKHRALFSERHGYEKVLRIGKWSIKYLR